MLHTSPALRAIAAALCLSFAGACNTFDTRSNPGYDGPPTYSGTRQASSYVAGYLSQFNLIPAAVFMLDTLLCAFADTLLLPLTAVEQSKWSEARANRQRTDLEQASLVLPAQGEDPLRTARRLFKACENLARNLNPTYTDCYSVDARIEVKEPDGEVRTLDGKEYKNEVKNVILARRGGTRFVRYLEPTFELEDRKVRVRAIREDSGDQERKPIEFVFGPGQDGGWRILEERSPGWR